jgi:hypothetical protein
MNQGTEESSVKQEPVDDSFFAEGPNKLERDPVRRGWYDEVEDGPYTITLAVHPADVLNNAPIKRRNYVMWIECIYSYYFVVTDPITPIFVEDPQFRDAYLIPMKDYPAAKDVYNNAEGRHVMVKQTPSALLGSSWDDFNLWQVAYNGRTCLIFGIPPGQAHLGVWTRTDMKSAFGSAQTDEEINRAFLALGHGDGDEDGQGRLINGALKKWKKKRTATSGRNKSRYNLRGSSAKLEASRESESE